MGIDYDKPLIQNPFTNAELEDVFLKQKNKAEFEIKKEVKYQTKCIVLTISSCVTENLDVWPFGYFVSFDYNNRNTTYGFGYPHNPFDDFEEFKAELFEVYNIEEDAQLSLF